jgi:hypothetical protein
MTSFAPVAARLGFLERLGIGLERERIPANRSFVLVIR